MTALGWAIMSISLAFVNFLTVFCLYRVLSLPPVEVKDLDIAPLDIDPHDHNNRN